MIGFAIIFALLLGACLFAALPHARTWQRATAVVTFVLLLGLVYAGSVDLLGWPKPLRLEWRATGEATVLAARMREGEAIYVWLQTGREAEPRAYALPWNMEMARQLHSALEERKSSGAGVRMSLGPESGGDARTPKFYAEPPPPLPPKPRLAGKTALFRNSGG